MNKADTMNIADTIHKADTMHKAGDDDDLPINLSEYIEEPWDIIGSYFKGKHLKQLVRHQIESSNVFVCQI